MDDEGRITALIKDLNSVVKSFKNTYHIIDGEVWIYPTDSECGTLNRICLPVGITCAVPDAKKLYEYMRDNKCNTKTPIPFTSIENGQVEFDDILMSMSNKLQHDQYWNAAVDEISNPVEVLSEWWSVEYSELYHTDLRPHLCDFIKMEDEYVYNRTPGGEFKLTDIVQWKETPKMIPKVPKEKSFNSKVRLELRKPDHHVVHYQSTSNKIGVIDTWIQVLTLKP